MITLVDAGPLVALIDRGQGATHNRCAEAIRHPFASLVTSWPCFTEAMYLLGRLRGWSAQKLLWQFYETKDGMEIYRFSDDEIRRMSELMGKYQNIPMDLADASLVTIAETTGSRRIFTLDSDFYLYRIHDTVPFEVVPLT